MIVDRKPFDSAAFRSDSLISAAYRAAAWRAVPATGLS
jgi:hypothetical protein